MKKTLLIALLVMLNWLSAVSQTKRDSLRLRTDEEAIRKGKPLKPVADQKSLLRIDSAIPAEVDTSALKPAFEQPTPPSPNNPNPHSPQPSAIHPSPPANPPSKPPVPPGTPKAPENTSVKKRN